MNYKLNTLGRETIRHFVRNNVEYRKCMDEYFEEAEGNANSWSSDFENGVRAVLLEPNQTIHRYEVLLILRAEHYDNAQITAGLVPPRHDL